MPHIFYCSNNEKIFNQPKFKSKLIKLTKKEYIEVSSDIKKNGSTPAYLSTKIIVEEKVKFVDNPDDEDIEVHNEPYIYSIELVK